MTSTPRTRGSLWTSIPSRLALMVVVLLLTSSVVTSVYAAVTLRSSDEASANNAAVNFHSATALSIRQMTADTRDYQADTLNQRKVLLKDLTAAQISAIDQFRQAADAGKITQAEARAQAEAMLNAFRYGDGNYFFAFSPDMNSIVEPNPTFRGNMLNYRDANGKQFFRDFRTVALTTGDGFVDYVGTRVGSSLPAAKVSYISYYKPWKWVVGTGVYLDDIAAETAARLDRAKQELSASLDKQAFFGSGFFFVLDRNGDVVAAPGDEMGALTSPAGRSLSKELVAAAPAGTTENHPVSAEAVLRDGVSEPWVFNVSTVEGQDWVLASAVPQAELTRASTDLALRQGLLNVAVLVLGLTVGVLTSRRIVKPLGRVTAAAIALEQNTYDPESLARVVSRRDEVGVLARAFRRMGEEVLERERALRARVQHLEVVVDKAKVEKDINDIAESDFFQDLERRADEIRKGD